MATKGKKQGFTAEEKAAMRERAKEAKGTGESDVLEKIAEMEGTDRALAERLHALVVELAPESAARTWYGMPAYAKDGKVVCFFRPAQKFKDRYATLGFNDNANLDDGAMWPTSYALTELTPDVEKAIGKLVEKAFG